MAVRCVAYLGMSLDGFIAGPNGELEWLDEPPNPDGLDHGFYGFMDSIDAIVMGRTTFETFMAFDVDWPYTKPLIVMSSTITEVPDRAIDTEISSLDPGALLAELESRGMTKLYIDGGSLVTSFLNAGLLDELITTVLPVALGTGIKLFGQLDQNAWFEHVSTEVFPTGLAQTTYRVSRNDES